MGYKSMLRSFGSAMRQAERNSARRARELEKQRALYAKLEAAQRAALEVEEYENYIERMTTLHKDCGDEFDWTKLVDKPKPVPPLPVHTQEEKARVKLDGYSPGFFDKVFKLDAKKKAKLVENLNKAIKEDEEVNLAARRDYEEDLNDHQQIVAIAQGILSGNLESFRQAVNEIDPLAEILEIGSNVVCDFPDPKRITVDLYVQDEKVIPRTSKSLLKSGKVSEKDLPQGRYNELYQDYVCSAALRVAREFFALLPVEEVHLTAHGKILNTSTGKKEEVPILKVQFIKETFKEIDMDGVDPSDAMFNFITKMNFKKTTGFSPIAQ